MNQIAQSFWLASVLPSTLFILLIALVAVLGVARWPRTLLALVLAARSRNWGWFSVILLAAIISALAANFAFSLYGLLVFASSSQAYQTYLQPPYIIITSVIASLNILAILLYALLGQRETAVVPDAA